MEYVDGAASRGPLPGETHGTPLGLCNYCFLCGEIDKAAEWLEKVIEQRNLLAAIVASMYFRSTARWPALARILNLPENAR